MKRMVERRNRINPNRFAFQITLGFYFYSRSEAGRSGLKNQGNEAVGNLLLVPSPVIAVLDGAKVIVPDGPVDE